MGYEISYQVRKLGNFLAEFPMHHCVPIYFGNPRIVDSKVNNGTATLLKRNGKYYVVTNHHVLEAYFERMGNETGISLHIGGLRVEDISSRLVFDSPEIDICVFEFSGCKESEFELGGNVPTEFYELGEIHSSINKGELVAFGGYPGMFRIRSGQNHLSFRTFSSGASVVHEMTDRNIIVSIDHDEASVTMLSLDMPPDDIAGLSGGPVFEISKTGLITTFRFAGIVAECNSNYQVMFAKPVSLFASAFK
jgi:hypothetical protein